MSDTQRSKLLKSLIVSARDTTTIMESLSEHDMRDDQELVTLTSKHIVDILKSFISGEVTSADVNHWAKAVKSHDDIELSKEAHKVVHALADPASSKPLTAVYAEELLKRLDD